MKAAAERTMLAIVLAPFALAFLIAASLAAGPREVVKLLRRRD